MNILTAQQFIAQGTSAGAILSIAEQRGHSPEIAATLRATAREVADITGQRLVIPGSVSGARELAKYNRRKRHANDNRRRDKRAA